MKDAEERLKQKLIELGYEPHPLMPETYSKKINNYCYLKIELETDLDYKYNRGLIHTAYVQSNFIIHEQRIIDEIQKAFNTLQEELKILEE